MRIISKSVSSILREVNVNYRNIIAMAIQTTSLSKEGT
jgi:hypothetical protein